MGKALCFFLLVSLLTSSSQADPGPTPSFFALGIGTDGVNVSADGDVAVGTWSHPSGYEAFRWTKATGLVGLGALYSPDYPSSTAFAASGDGSVIVGRTATPPPTYGTCAYRWTASTGMICLTSPLYFGQAFDVSSDGSTVVGDNEAAIAFRWTASTGMMSLGDLPGGPNTSHAAGVSGDGQVVVGTGRSTGGPNGEAFRWTAATGMVGLGGFLPLGGSTLSEAFATSYDGSVVVGWSYKTLNGYLEPIRITLQSGM